MHIMMARFCRISGDSGGELRSRMENLMDDEFITIPDYTPVLTPLPVSSWRSLGGYFNYARWPQRERFLELDKAIVIAKEQQQREGHRERAEEVAERQFSPRDEPGFRVDLLPVNEG